MKCISGIFLSLARESDRIALSRGKNYSPRIAKQPVIGYNLTFAAARLAARARAHTHTHTHTHTHKHTSLRTQISLPWRAHTQSLHIYLFMRYDTTAGQTRLAFAGDLVI